MTGSKTTVSKGTETRTSKPTAENGPSQVPNKTRPNIRSDTSRLPFTEAQAMVGLDNNSAHVARRKAVAELRAKCPCQFRESASLRTGTFALRVFNRELRHGNACRVPILLLHKFVFMPWYAYATRSVFNGSVVELRRKCFSYCHGNTYLYPDVFPLCLLYLRILSFRKTRTAQRGKFLRTSDLGESPSSRKT